MLDLREQARHEAWVLHQQAEYRPFAGQYADAASDIWEPALRHMAKEIVRIHDWHGKPFYGKHHQCDACAMGRDCPIRDLLNRAKEILDG